MNVPTHTGVAAGLSTLLGVRRGATRSALAGDVTRVEVRTASRGAARTQKLCGLAGRASNRGGCRSENADFALQGLVVESVHDARCRGARLLR